MPFISLDTWTLIFTWLNLFILFLIVKHLFFKPMQKMLDARNAEIKASYDKADELEKAAGELKASYEERIAGAKAEADRIVSDAVSNASLRSDSIMKEAEEKAAGMIERAEKNIEAQKQSAYSELRSDVSSMAVDIAGTIIAKEISEKEHEKLINEALKGLGGSNE